MVICLLFWIDDMGRPALYVWMIVFGIVLNGTNACAHAASRSLFGTRMAGVTGGAYGCCAFMGGAATQIVCGELLAYAQKMEWDPGLSYLFAFAPFILCGLVATWVGFTLSRKADDALRGQTP